MKGHNKPYPKKIRQKAFRLMSTGATARELEKKLELSLSTAKMWRSAFLAGTFVVEPVRDKHPKELRAKAFSLFEEGKGYKAVANALSVPMYTVRDWYRSYKTGPFMNPEKRFPGLTPEDKEKILALAKEGRSCSEIVAMTGFKFYPVRYFLRKIASSEDLDDGLGT